MFYLAKLFHNLNALSTVRSISNTFNIFNSFFFFAFSFTNFLLINLLALVSFRSSIYCNASHKNYLQETAFFYFIAIKDKYFPIISVVFNLILFCNLIGLIPYSFTPTSYLITTFSLFFGIFIITFEKHKIKMFSLFLPTFSKFLLALLLSPIELISYIAKPISLGVRLFINLMAGHSLLKVIVGFSYIMLSLKNLFWIGFFLPIIILVMFFGLEVVVAWIQTYVFIILICLYINAKKEK